LTSDDPIIYRVTFDDGAGPLEVGSISERTRHAQQNQAHWHWGVDIMPLMDHGGHPPEGDAWSRDAALQAFKAAFMQWLNDLHPGDWQRNRDYIKASTQGRR
jgi:hypothetical protein